MNQQFQLLARYLAPQKGQAGLLGLLVTAGIALQLANPQLVRQFLDAVESGSGVERLLGAAGIFTAIAIVRQGVVLAAAYVGENVAWTATNALRADLALHCLRLDVTFHKTHKPGELIERVDGDVNQLAEFFSKLVIQLFTNLLLLCGVVVMLWLLDWRIGLTLALISLVSLASLRWLNQLSIPRWERVRQASAELFGYLEEWISGMEDIRSSAAEPFVMHRLHHLSFERLRAMQRAIQINKYIYVLPLLVFTIAYMAAHVLGTTLFAQSAITIGGIYLIFFYIDIIKDPLWQIGRQLEYLQRASASINRIVALFALQPTMTDGPGVAFEPGPLAVAFEGVSFAYEDDPHSPVLSQVSFRLDAGNVLGLLGRTGSGKSTLTRLLFRFYDPTEGEIRLGGHLLNQAQRAQLGQRVGVVTQDVELFHASVRDNLTLFDAGISDHAIQATLTELGLAGWLDGLPDGLDSILSGHGGLSAGQAQLLAFARVFLRDPGLVILDEASSRLDPVTEQLIERAIDRLLANRTAIIVAHRLSTVQRADDILILGNGNIVEYDRRAVLANDPTSRFYQLLQTGLETLA